MIRGAEIPLSELAFQGSDEAGQLGNSTNRLLIAQLINDFYPKRSVERTWMKNLILKLICISPLGIFLALGVEANASNHDAIKEALEAKYQHTKTGIDRIRITQPGTV